MSYMYILQHTHDPPNNQSSSVNRSKVGALQGSRRRKEGETLLMQGGGGTPQLGPSGGQFGCSDEDEDFLSANRALQSRVIKPFRPPYFRPEESDDVRPTSPNRRPKVSLTRKQKTFTSGVRGSPDPDLSTPFPTSHVATCNFIFNFFFLLFFIPSDDASVNSTSDSRSAATPSVRPLIHSSKALQFPRSLSLSPRQWLGV